MIEGWLDRHTEVSPGWADRLSGAIAARSVPQPVTYALSWLVLFGLFTAVEWSVQAYPVGTFQALHVVLIAGVVLPVYLVSIFNRSAMAAMARVRPLLAVDDAEAELITRRLTSTPAALEAAFIVFVIGVTTARIELDASWWQTLQLSITGAGGPVAIFLIVAFATSVATLAVKIAFMSAMILRISRRELSVSLWELGPLNGFAILTAQFAATLMLLAVSIYATRQELLKDALGIWSAVFGVAFAGVVFVLPLMGIHGRLVSEKARLRGDAAKAMEASIKGLHLAIEAADPVMIDAQSKAITGVEIEIRTLSAIPTWPWLPETFRWVVGALMFPVVLFLFQLIITRVAASGSGP